MCDKTGRICWAYAHKYIYNHYAGSTLQKKKKMVKKVIPVVLSINDKMLFCPCKMLYTLVVCYHIVML